MRNLLFAVILVFVGMAIADTFFSTPCSQAVAANLGKGGGKKTGK